MQTLVLVSFNELDKMSCKYISIQFACAIRGRENQPNLINKNMRCHTPHPNELIFWIFGDNAKCNNWLKTRKH